MGGVMNPPVAERGITRPGAGGPWRRSRWALPGPVGRLLPVTAPALLALILGLAGIGERQLWRDEHSTYWASTLSVGDLRHLLQNVDIVFAPYYVFMHGWISLFGGSPVALRLPAVAGMAVAAALLSLLGRQLAGTAVGLIAGLAFAVLPSVTRYGQEARPYAFVIAAVIAATLLLLRALDRPGSRVAWAAYAVALVAIGWTHLVALSVLVAHAAFVLMAARDTAAPGRAAQALTGRALLLRWLAATGLGLLPTAPLAVKAVGQTGQIGWIEGSNPSLLTYPELLFQSGFMATVVLVLAVAGAGLLRSRALPLLVWAVVPPLALLATFDLFHLFYFRYLLFTLPAWVLLAAVAVWRAARLVAGVRGPTRIIAVAAGGVALATVLGLSLADQAAVRRDPPPGEPDFKAAAAVVAGNDRPGDVIAYGGDANGGIKSVRRAMAYELRAAGGPVDVFLELSPQARGQFAGVEYREPGLRLGGRDRVWLITHAASGNPFAQMPEERAALLQTEFKVTRSWRFTQIKVLLLDRLPVPASAHG